MSANEPLAIGIDIGGTGTKFGIVDSVGNVLFSGEMSTKKHAEVGSFIVELHEKLSVLINRWNWKNERNWCRRPEWKLLQRHH
jgi:glucokinase